MENIIIGGKIAKARKQANLSQAQLAEQLFISPQAVGKWERGEAIPDIVTISKLAKILGLELNYFSESTLSPDAGLRPKVANATGAMEQPLQEEAGVSGMQERQLLTNFNGSALAESDFTGLSAPKRKFVGSDLHGANFSKADLSGSTFMGSDAREANFDGTNLTDCSFSALDLTGASFHSSILVRTQFSSATLHGVKFSKAALVDVRLSKTDLTKTVFENCSFNGVDFNASDMSGLSFDGQTFIGVKFDNTSLKDASFKGAILKHVSFRPTFALTNRYYKTLKTICFDGATMDKLTYAALKGVGLDLSKVAIH